MARNVFAPGLVITVALVATLSGCGGEDGPQAQAAPPTPAFVQGTTAPRAQPLVTPKPQSTSARPARTPVPRATPADTVRITIQNFKFSP
ncbi:MAG TPA: hypothetical protein VMZ00_16965, partial [Sporichthya sp.]|nr:hypothetical protein [Sporichthya sp.]